MTPTPTLTLALALTPGRTRGVDATEFGNTLTKLFGWRPTRFEIEKLMKIGDPDGDGEISFPEFVLMLTAQMSGRTGRTLAEVTVEP